MAMWTIWQFVEEIEEHHRDNIIGQSGETGSFKDK